MGAGDPSGPAGGERPRVAYLGPAGTFTEEALLASARPESVEPVPYATIYDTVLAVRSGAARWAVAPIENSLEGSVTVTLDMLAETGTDWGDTRCARIPKSASAAGACPPASVETGTDKGDTRSARTPASASAAGECSPAVEEGARERIVGEVLLPVRHSLLAAEPVALDAIDTVVSHPQVPGQCTRLLRGELAHARVVPATSTAEAVRLVAAERRPGQAALGTRLAGELYGAVVVREGVQDRDDNITRFVWLGRADGDGGEPPPLRAVGDGDPPPQDPPTRWKTSIAFWGAGADSPGWLVRCLDEFARRELNLTKIESRPQRARLGHYVFFVDLQGAASEPAVAEALAGVRAVCEHVRLLGSYRAG